MATWTPSDMPDLSGRVAIVTGANSGLGFETSLELARHGATVVMACRDEGRCAHAAEKIRAAAPTGRVEPMHLDLADLDSVRAFSEAFLARDASLDILVNNAGVMATPRRMLTEQGFELQFGVNHLAHFALTGLLLPALQSATAARIVTVSSFAHEGGRIDFGDLQLERHYAPYRAYNASKLANLLFMLELDRRLRQARSRAISVGAHPGFTSTRLQATGPFLGKKRLSSYLVLAAVRLVGQSPRAGAEPLLYAATEPDVAGGDYYGPALHIRGHVTRAHMSAGALDASSAEKLWHASEDLTGVAFAL